MLKTAYILLFIILWGIIMTCYNSALIKMNVDLTLRKKRMTIATICILLWFFVQYLVLNTGFYLNYSLPPRIPIFIIFPLFAFTAIFLYRNRNSSILHAIPIHIPIAYQSFRAVIEVLFYFTFIKGILPVQVTFEGYNYDVLLGISAIFMAFYAYKNPSNKKLLIAWNLIGIAIVGFAAFTFITSFYFPSIWGTDGQGISTEFLQYPYLLLPTFFMPSAIFVHALSIIQLRKNK